MTTDAETVLMNGSHKDGEQKRLAFLFPMYPIKMYPLTEPRSVSERTWGMFFQTEPDLNRWRKGPTNIKDFQKQNYYP
jgi:hypothetical protein